MEKKSSFRARDLAIVAVMTALSIVLTRAAGVTIGPLRVQFGDLPVIVTGMMLGWIPGLAVGAVADVVGGVLVGYAINPIITIGAASVGFVAGVAYGFLRRLPDNHPIIAIGARCLRAVNWVVSGVIELILRIVEVILRVIGMILRVIEMVLHIKKHDCSRWTRLTEAIRGGLGRWLEAERWPERFRVLLTVALAHLVGSVAIKTAGLVAYGYGSVWPILTGRALLYTVLGFVEWLIILAVMPQIWGRFE